MLHRTFSLVFAAGVLAACGVPQVEVDPSSVPGKDAGAALDGGATASDAGAIDAGSPDAGPVDAGIVVVPVDEAEIVSDTLPAQLGCLATRTATVTVRNTGTTTWTAVDGYKLGAVDDSDPLSSEGRRYLAAGDSVAPGSTHTFEVTLVAPKSVGTVKTDWRMVREGVRWFGATAARTVTVDGPGCILANGDMLDLSQVSVFNSPADVASWPVTTKISQLQMQSGDIGISLDFPAKATWPDYTPPGWMGPIEYTVWAVVKVGGQWCTSGFIQMWRTRPSTGAPILTDFAKNWAYDTRWGPMAGYNPHQGEQMGFFVTAGNARGEGTVTSLRERSNVVLLSLPAGDTGLFNF